MRCWSRHCGGSGPRNFSFQPSIEASGGLLTVWDHSVVDVWTTSSFGHVFVIRGRVLISNEEFIIANVYAPCDTALKQALWGRLQSLAILNAESNLCFSGDFNSIRTVAERKSRGSVFRQQDADIFNSFIDESFLVDLPLCGRLFTWYRGDRVSMSRLDRFLLFDKWCLTWQNCVQIALQRGLSDHVPLVLRSEEENWGPRPLRILKCWSDVPGYADIVRVKWSSFDVHGWGAYVLKEKLWLIKGCLKEWHQQHTLNMERRLCLVKDKMSNLDSKGETFFLDEAEVMEILELSEKLHSLSWIQASMSWQKARQNWLQEGDVNTNFFHGLIVAPFFGDQGYLISV